MENKIDLVCSEIEIYLTKIKTFFKSSAKITLIVRHEGTEDGSKDLILTDDSLADAIVALKQRSNDLETFHEA